MLKVTTSHTSTATGAGRIVAKGGGKQRTIPFNHEAGAVGSHRLAAETLAGVLGVPVFPRSETVELDKNKVTFLFG